VKILHRWHAHATAQNERVQVQRVSNASSAPSFSPYRRSVKTTVTTAAPKKIAGH
jgi:hypothetical protein